MANDLNCEILYWREKNKYNNGFINEAKGEEVYSCNAKKISKIDKSNNTGAPVDCTYQNCDYDAYVKNLMIITKNPR